jgi:hypothetical protein
MERKHSNQGRNRRRLVVLALITLVSVPAVGMLAGAQSVADQPARTASVVPGGLFTDLVRLDRTLARLIDRVRTDGFQPEDVTAIKGIQTEKLNMVDRFFGQTVYGVKFSEVFDQLDLVDGNLYRVLGVFQGNPLRGLAFRTHYDDLILGFIERAKKQKQELEAELHKQADVPEGLLTDFVRLDRTLARLIDRVRTDGFQPEDVTAIKGIQTEKLNMVDRFFGQTVYGVKFSEVFDQLDLVDGNLYRVLGVFQGNPLRGLAFRTHYDDLILGFIERAKKQKQKLEAELHKADGTLPPSGGGSGRSLGASILRPAGTATFLDGQLAGGTTADVAFQGQIAGGDPPYTSTIVWGDGSTGSGVGATHAYPAGTSLSDGKMTYPLRFDARDSGGHTASATTTITVLCAGVSGAGFTADLGSGSMPTIVFCGHWSGGFVPAKVLYMPASGQDWQFNGAFNIFENHQTCPNPTASLVAGCQPKDTSENPTVHFGGAFNINAPAVMSGMKITVEGEDSAGNVIQTFTGTVP